MYLYDDIQLFLASPEDAPVLAGIRQKAWAAAYRGIYPDAMIDDFDFKAHAQRFLEQINKEDAEVYVIRKENCSVGYLIVGKTSFYKDFSVCLHSLYLIPECHRMGIGRHIMEFVKCWCQERGFSSFYNSCNLHNYSARAFYEAVGGKLGAVDDGYDDPGADQCYYEYILE